MTNLSKTFDDSFKKDVNSLIRKGIIDMKKEMPEGAVYSASKKPPEGAREFTTDRGTKYWVPKMNYPGFVGEEPKQRKKTKEESEEIDRRGAEQDKETKAEWEEKKYLSRVTNEMAESIPKLSDDKLKENITTNKKHMRNTDKDSPKYKAHKFAVWQSEKEQIKRQKDKPKA